MLLGQREKERIEKEEKGEGLEWIREIVRGGGGIGIIGIFVVK